MAPQPQPGRFGAAALRESRPRRARTAATRARRASESCQVALSRRGKPRPAPAGARARPIRRAWRRPLDAEGRRLVEQLDGAVQRWTACSRCSTSRGSMPAWCSPTRTLCHAAPFRAHLCRSCRRCGDKGLSLWASPSPRLPDERPRPASSGLCTTLSPTRCATRSAGASLSAAADAASVAVQVWDTGPASRRTCTSMFSRNTIRSAIPSATAQGSWARSRHREATDAADRLPAALVPGLVEAAASRSRFHGQPGPWLKHRKSPKPARWRQPWSPRD